VSRHGPGISHLFTNDTLLFMEILEEKAVIVRNTLCCCERCTWHLINQSKCSLMFGLDVEHEDKNHVMQALQVTSVAVEEKYLGLPTPHGCMTKDKYKSTKQRLAKRFSSWAECFMSLGAKKILIKSVSQVIPTYVKGGL
jgi:hypothetical protein